MSIPLSFAKAVEGLVNVKPGEPLAKQKKRPAKKK